MRETRAFNYFIFSALLVFLCFLDITSASAQVINPSGAKTLCVGGAAVTLDDITVGEGVDGDFGTGASFTYIIQAPTNFQFVNTSGSAFISSGSELSNLSFTRGTSTFTITYDHAPAGGLDEFTITGLQVQALTTPSGPSNVLTDNGATSTSPAAVNTINHGTLTSDQPTSAVLAGNATICTGSSTNLTVTITGGATPYTIQIDNGVGVIGGYASGSNIVVSPTSTTTYNLISVTDANGCTGTGLSGTPTVTVDLDPTLAVAGPDQQVCNTSTTLAGNTPTTGTGLWTISSGAGGSFTSNTDPTTDFSGVAGTTYTLRWTTSNGVCTDSFDEVDITFDQNPTTANAGADQTGASAICGTSTTLAGNAATIGTGMWTETAGDGNGAFTDPTSPTTTFTGTGGQTYTLTWTISNGVCPSSGDDVDIQFDLDPTPAVAGPDQQVCNTSTTLAGNAPTTGTGLWTIESGAGGSFTTNTDPTTDFSGTAGTTYTLRWTTSNGVCTDSFDE
ncbi:MAG: hypothetical protein AAFX87_31170, partial [Bacteroidota bacterium]